MEKKNHSVIDSSAIYNTTDSVDSFKVRSPHGSFHYTQVERSDSGLQTNKNKTVRTQTPYHY